MARKIKTSGKLGTRIRIEELIHSIRGERVILDSDLARIYGVETGALNRAVKRNKNRFPPDFLFQLNRQESLALKCQIGISNNRRGGRRYFPYAFTEHGAIMAANVINSPKAIQMSVFVIRAFVKMRAALNETVKMAEKLSALEQEIKGRLDTHEKAIVDVLQQLMEILNPDEILISDNEPKREIGFHAKEEETEKNGKPKKE